MAGCYSNKNYGGNNSNMNKEERILCSVDKKWERMDQFSNNELKKYTNAKRTSRPYNIRCRKHTQAPRLELTCSNCDERKPYEDFSNAQRKEDADLRRCRICVDYTETIDLFQGMSVLGRDADPDNYKLESSGPDDESEEQPEEDPGVGGLAFESGAWAAACGRGRNVDLTSNVLNRHNDSSPRFPQAGDYSASSAPTDTASVSSDETRRLRRQPENYIAYGPNGQKQQRAQSVITASETASVATSATGATAIATNRGGWAKVKSRKMPIQAPDLFTHGKVDENFAPKRYDHSYSGSDDEC